MGLLSKFKFGSQSGVSTPPAGASSDASEVARDARIRARRRLIGASLLLGLGIVGFPLLFESRPRPIPVDIPIEIPAREGAAPLALPTPHAGKGRADAQPAQPVDDVPASAALGERESIEPDPRASGRAAAEVGAGALAAAGAVAAVKAATGASHPAAAPSKLVFAVTEPKAAPAKPEAPKPQAAKSDAPKPEAPKPAASKPTPPKPVAKAEAKPEPKPEPKPAASKPAEHPADEGRFVVQIGAFAEVASAREARMKVEGLGLKTYTQVIESATGRRIRVRVGPYPTKAEADKAAARIKAGGLQAAVLVL